jgi:hypothetical protein
MKNLRRSVSATILGILMFVASGCTSTMKIAATPDTEFTGKYRSKRSLLNVSGNGAAVYELSGSRLEECEFRKNDPQKELSLIVHRGLFTGSLTAPPGSAGVRATRDGMGYRMEMIP